MNTKTNVDVTDSSANNISAATEPSNGVYTQQPTIRKRKSTFTPKQSRLTLNKKRQTLGFTAATTAPKDYGEGTSRGGLSNVDTVCLVQSDSSEEENPIPPNRQSLVDEESLTLLRETPMRQLRDVILSRSKRDIVEWKVFSDFADQMFPHEYETMDRQTSNQRMYYPTKTLLLLHFLPLVRISTNTPFTVLCEYLEEMLQADRYNSDHMSVSSRWTTARKELSAMMNRLPVFQYIATSNTWTVCKERSLTELWIIGLQYLQTVPEAIPLESMPASSAIDMWTLTESTYRRYVSRTALMGLHEYFTSSRWDWLDRTHPQRIDGECSASTATTSMSCTPARTQTVLAVVRGSREAQGGDVGDGRDIDEEFTSLTSRFRTGRPSLDISLSRDTQPNTLVASVLMEEWIYDLRLYRLV